jgi:hypothetical protein
VPAGRPARGSAALLVSEMFPVELRPGWTWSAMRYRYRRRERPTMGMAPWAVARRF